MFRSSNPLLPHKPVHAIYSPNKYETNSSLSDSDTHSKSRERGNIKKNNEFLNENHSVNR